MGNMRFKYSRFLIILVALLCFFQSEAKARTGAALWAPLTPFEIKTLNNVRAARSGDADALLALALIASGDVRRQRDFDAIQKQVHQLIRKTRPTIKKNASIFAKGEKLLKAMHDRYLVSSQNGSHSELVYGYDIEQSKVSAIFQDGKFNCISSAILYMILARYFDLDVQGVVTTQHAFVQINAPRGRPIEVETTSKRGYGLVHDKAFYEKRFAAFSMSRNLVMPTYQDYLNRRVLSPFMLIVKNMNHQHTHPDRMDKATRQRLFEIQGYLDGDTAASQVNRLSIYQNSMIKLLKDQNSPKARKLTQVIEPVVRQIKSRSWIGHIRDKDVEAIWERLGAIHTLWGHLLLADKAYDAAERQYGEALQWAYTGMRKAEAQKNIHKARAFGAFDNQHWQKAIAAYQNLLSHLQPSDEKLIRQTHENIAAAYLNWGISAAAQTDWKAAAAHYGAVEQWTQKNATIKKARTAQVNATAMYHFKGGRWQKAIHYFKEALTIQDRKNRASTRHNIGSAYINWGNALFHAKRYWPALEKYEAALEVMDKGKKAMVHRNVMAAYQQLTARLLKEKKVDEAITIMKPSTERFPGCAPCRKEVSRLTRLAAAQKKNNKL